MEGIKKGRPWTRRDEEKLISMYPTTPQIEIARKMNRTHVAIRNKCFKLGLNWKIRPNKIILTEEEELWFRYNFPNLRNEFLAIKFNCSKRTIIQIARKLRLKKSRNFFCECRKYAYQQRKYIQELKKAI